MYLDVQESQEKGVLESKDKWPQFAAEVNVTKDSVGYMKPLVRRDIPSNENCKGVMVLYNFRS